MDRMALGAIWSRIADDYLLRTNLASVTIAPLYSVHLNSIPQWSAPMTPGFQDRRGIVVVLAVAIGLLSVVGNASAADKSTPTDLFLGMKPDAHKGYEAIMTMPMAAPSMKVSDLERLWQVWEEEEKAKAKKADRAELMRMTFERYGWAMRPGDKVCSLP